MKFFIIKFFLGLFGFIFLATSVVSITIIIKTIYFSENNILEQLFTNNQICEDQNIDKNIKYCIEVVTTYWMFMLTIISSILSFINLFPFFIMKKK